jgi:hypothetical protein
MWLDAVDAWVGGPMLGDIDPLAASHTCIGMFDVW